MMSEPVLAPEDDRFWLQRAGAIVNDTITQLDNAASRLANAMAWFWTAYAAVALVTINWTGTASSTAAALALAAPAVLIFAAYLSATFATLPIEVGFNDQVPLEVKAAHDLAVRRRRRRIKVSAGLAAVAALSVALAVSVTAVTKAQDPRDAAVIGMNGDRTRVLAGGKLVESEEVTVRLVRPDGRSLERAVPVVDGTWETSFVVSGSGSYEVTVSWTVGEVRHSVVEELQKP